MIVAALVLLGCWTYSLLAIIGALRHARLNIPKVPGSALSPVSVLKPLAGLDQGLEENLRSYFLQDYSNYELLFAVRETDDPAIPVVQRLMEQHPRVPAKLILTGEPPYPHAKVFSLTCMLAFAQHPLIAMGDSDVRVGPDFCRRLAQEFSDATIDLVTCPYRAVGGPSFWSQLEALGMNTEFHAGLFTAVLVEGMKFAVGPTIVARRKVIDAIGGIERVKDYLAEDYMLGNLAAAAGFGVRLSSYVVEHRIGSESLVQNFEHRLRWARSTRRSRPSGYIGQFFTYPLPITVIACSLVPHLWPALLVTAILHGTAMAIVGRRILHARVNWLLLPLQDFLSFGFWIAGFFGNTILWRGRRYLLKRDGTMDLAS